jgi:hypothetical protein
MPRYKLRTLLIATTILSMYLAAYRATMEPTIYVDEGNVGIVSSGYRAPGYRVNEPVARIVFWPLAWIDQKLRPGFWGPYSDTHITE